MSTDIRGLREDIESLRQTMRAMQNDMPNLKRSYGDVYTLMGLTGLRNVPAVRALTISMYQLKAAYDAWMIARMAGGDPFAWFSAIVQGVATGVTIVDMAGCYG